MISLSNLPSVFQMVLMTVCWRTTKRPLWRFQRLVRSSPKEVAPTVAISTLTSRWRWIPTYQSMKVMKLQTRSNLCWKIVLESLIPMSISNLLLYLKTKFWIMSIKNYSCVSNWLTKAINWKNSYLKTLSISAKMESRWIRFPIKLRKNLKLRLRTFRLPPLVRKPSSFAMS